jgi:hypothetical protein
MSTEKGGGCERPKCLCGGFVAYHIEDCGCVYLECEECRMCSSLCRSAKAAEDSFINRKTAAIRRARRGGNER